MKRSSSGQRGPPDSVLQNLAPDKVGWIRKFCGKGIFREIWKNRFVLLRGDQLFICEKEVKELGRADEALDLSDYERCEEVRKNKSRSKKNHSKFRLQRCSSPGNTVPHLVFLAISPEDKESWITVLNVAITRAKNRILDEVVVQVQDSQLSHLTRDRAKIPHPRRLPTRGHLLAVASTCSSDGTLTVDLIQGDGFREDSEELEPEPGPDCPRPQTDGAARAAEPSGKSQSVPRETAMWDKDQVVPTAEKKQVLARSESRPGSRLLQDLISQKLERTEQLLREVRVHGDQLSPEGRVQAQRLLEEAAAAWTQAREVLEELKELKELYKQLDQNPKSLM